MRGEKTTESHDEDDIYHCPAFEKLEYGRIFSRSSGYWGPSVRLSFYAHAEASVTLILKRLEDGFPPLNYEGTAPLFLFRHYLELTLKGIVMGVRYLEASNNKASHKSIIPVSEKHPLRGLWTETQNKIPAILKAGVWGQWDHKFVEQCISEFEEVDPTSVRLRYGGIDQWTDNESLEPVQVNWSALLRNMQHTRDVLEHIDTYLIEAHGLQADWKAEQQSW